MYPPIAGFRDLPAKSKFLAVFFDDGGCLLVFEVGRPVGNLNYLQKIHDHLHSLLGQP